MLMPLRTASRLLVMTLCLGPSALSPKASAAPPTGPVTPAEAEAFGASLVQAAEKKDVVAYNALLDWDTIVSTSMKGIDAPAKFQQGFRKGVLDSLSKPTGFSAKMVRQIERGGSYRMVRTRVRGRRTTALLRLLGADGAVNYHEFILGRAANGNVRAVDLYIFSSGELLSQSFRRSYVHGAAEQNQGFLARLAGNEQEFVKGFVQITEVNRLVKESKYREALAMLDAMPKVVQDDKLLLLVRLGVTQKLDEASYARTIERIRTHFPEDADLDLISIDGYIILKQHDKALAAVARLEKSVGGDPYLQILRASILSDAGKPAEARKAVEAAVADCPELITVHWILVGLTLAAKDNAATLKALKLIDERFEMEFGDLKEVPEYAAFVESPQYAEWKAYLAAKKLNAGAAAPEPKAKR